MQPTQEQSDILDAERSTKSNLMINALAGMGKSATLKMIDRQAKTRPALYLVFNKRNPPVRTDWYNPIAHRTQKQRPRVQQRLLA